ncbi:MAG: hypothetical protein R3C49_22420 [Planctomycetaceae bacterium]
MSKQLRKLMFIFVLMATLATLGLWVTSCLSPIAFRVENEAVFPATAFERNVLMGISLKPGYIDIEYVGDPLESLEAGHEILLNSKTHTAFLGWPASAKDIATPTGVRVNYANDEICRGGMKAGKWHECFTSPVDFASDRLSQCCCYQSAFGRLVFLEIPFYLPALVFGYWPALRLLRRACRRPAD